MSVFYNENVLLLNLKRFIFEHEIASVVSFPRCVAVMLAPAADSEDEVYALDWEGNLLWNISVLTPGTAPQIYTSISADKEDETILNAYAFSGILLRIDTEHSEVIERILSK